jgi:uncharacterized protein YecE (DUF72 family)
MKKGRAYIGTSNVELPVPNKDHFPPEYRNKSRLAFYASLFNSVEINSSFYKIPMPRTVEKWVNDVPEDFRFTFKLWKDITHAKELDFQLSDIDRFFASVNMSGSKKGCILIQFPASVKASQIAKLKKLLDHIHSVDGGDSWKLAIEFRDSSWYKDKVYQLLEQYAAAVVVHDIPKSATPYIEMDSAFVYLRFHGENGDYRGSYPDDLLAEHAQNLNDWQAEGKDVFAYFNNTIGGAVHNALFLKDQLEGLT